MATTPPAFDALMIELRSCGDDFEQFFAAQCTELEQTERRLSVAAQRSEHTADVHGEHERMVAEQTALRQALEERVDRYFHQIEQMQAEMEGLASRSLQQHSEDESARQQLAEQLREAEAQRDAAALQRSAAEEAAAQESRRLQELAAEIQAQREELARAAQASADAVALQAARVAELETALAVAQSQGGDRAAAALAEVKAEKEDLINRLSILERERVGWLSERRLARAQANAVAEQAAKLSADQEQLNQARLQMADDRGVLVHQRQEAEAALARRAEQVERELADMRRDLDLARSQAARADQTAVSLASARSELADVKARLAQALEENGLLRRQGERQTPVVELQQVSELEHERALLESELEMIRNRAAELTETLADEKRRMAHERTEWTSELKQIRTTLVSQAAGEAPAARRAADPLAAARPGSSAGDSGNHAVVDSVMAQFELLQKDRRRRGQQDVA